MFGCVCLCVSGRLVNKRHQARKSYCAEASPHQLLLISIGSDLLLNCVAVLQSTLDRGVDSVQPQLYSEVCVFLCVLLARLITASFLARIWEQSLSRGRSHCIDGVWSFPDSRHGHEHCVGFW